MSNLSFIPYIGNGVTKEYGISFTGADMGYLRQSDVKVLVDGVQVSSTINPASPHLVILDEAPQVGSQIIVRREMPIETPYADFSRGNNFGYRQVNNSFLQQLYLTHELLDGFYPEGFYFKQAINFGRYPLKNIGDGVEDTDAVSVGQAAAIAEKAVGANFVQEEVPTAGVVQGSRWYKPSVPTVFTYYIDTSGSGQWVEEPSVGDDISIDNIGGLGDSTVLNSAYIRSFANVQEMKSYSTHSAGNKCSTGGTTWLINNLEGIPLGNGLFSKPLNGITINDYILSDPITNTSIFQEAMSLSTTIINQTYGDIIFKGLDISIDKVKLLNYGRITLDTSSSNGRGVILSGYCSEISGGGEIVASDDNYMPYLVYLSGDKSKVEGLDIHYPSKPNYTGDGTNIPYNTGCVGISEGAKGCKVYYCTIYNAEGASVYSLGSEASIKGGEHHSNIYGVCLAAITTGLSDNSEIIGVRIRDNNAATKTLSGADGILTFKKGKGHTISYNKISGSQEHGTYIQSGNTSVIGNHAWLNYGSGIKAGGALNSTISNNICWENVQGEASGLDDADIYVQSPFGNSSISNNTSTGSGSFGIRVVWVSNKQEGEDKRIVLSGNVVTGAALDSIRVNGVARFIISNNITDGQVTVGSTSANSPTMEHVKVAGNVTGQMLIQACTRPIITNNDSPNIILFANSNVVVRDNDFYNQSSRIAISNIDEWSRNEVSYSGSSSFFEQGSNSASNSNKKITENSFILNGARVVYFTTEGISGNNIVFDGNILKGQGVQPFYAWGDNHSFCNNKTYDPSNASLAFIRGTNCVITSNIGQISTENTATHEIANNTSPV